METVALQSEHLGEAAELFSACYREERRLVPTLPPRHEANPRILELLIELAGRAPGVVALEGDRLRGYLLGMALPSFEGTRPGVYCPIWAHAVAGEGPARAAVYQQMYAHLSREWLARGWLAHAITIYAQDSPAVDAWFRSGFGLLTVDAIRGLEPLPIRGWPGPEEPDLEIRPAAAADAGRIRPLVQGLIDHLADAPIFYPPRPAPGEADLAEWLTQPGQRYWLALRVGVAVGYIRTQPPQPDVAYVVHDPGTISITGAFVRPSDRGQGVATALLAQVLAEARATGYARCSVDFESRNALGSRFWLRHFEPVCYSLLRRVDERILPVGSQHADA